MSRAEQLISRLNNLPTNEAVTQYSPKTAKLFQSIADIHLLFSKNLSSLEQELGKLNWVPGEATQLVSLTVGDFEINAGKLAIPFHVKYKVGDEEQESTHHLLFNKDGKYSAAA